MHKSVFLEEAVEYLALREGSVVVDATFGGGGHTRRICERVGAHGRVIAIDQDPDALPRMEKVHDDFSIMTGVHENFRHLDAILDHHEIETVDAVLFDFGLSQFHLDESGRGFSFRKSEPLDMRMNLDAPLTAATIVNSYTEKDIADIIYQYGEERRSRKIARMIVQHRHKEPITQSDELADIVARAYPPNMRHGRTHPATRTFQALRIAVNEELSSIEEGLHHALSRLSTGGRCVAISFHSLEDRIVKNMFREEAQKKTVRLLTKKPLIVTEAARAENPRARSAKMRVAERLGGNEE